MRDVAVRLVALLALVLLAAGPVVAQPADAPTGQVVYVVDGDTLDVQLADGRLERVRVTGIDTPETKHPSLPVQCFGPEASAKTTELALGKAAALELDVQQRDRYGRLLAYIWIDGVMLNHQLAVEGYALPLTIPPNVRYSEQFVVAAGAARDAGLGLWGGCGSGEEAADVGPTTEDVEAPTPPPPALQSDHTAPASLWECPNTHPIKGNHSSMIYHMPGGAFYDRTQPEDCFANEAAAQAAGYRRSLR